MTSSKKIAPTACPGEVSSSARRAALPPHSPIGLELGRPSSKTRAFKCASHHTTPGARIPSGWHFPLLPPATVCGQRGVHGSCSASTGRPRCAGTEAGRGEAVHLPPRPATELLYPRSDNKTHEIKKIELGHFTLTVEYSDLPRWRPGLCVRPDGVDSKGRARMRSAQCVGENWAAPDGMPTEDGPDLVTGLWVAAA